MVTLESASLGYQAANDTLHDGNSVHAAPLNQPLVIDLDFGLLQSGRLVELAKREASRGRRVVLVTASHRQVAGRVMKRFAFASEVLALNGLHGMKDAAKARRLTDLFPQGFVFVGDQASDLNVWQDAQSAVGVNLDAKTAMALAGLGKPMLLLNDSNHPDRTRTNGERLKAWVSSARFLVPLFLIGLTRRVRQVKR